MKYLCKFFIIIFCFITFSLQASQISELENPVAFLERITGEVFSVFKKNNQITLHPNLDFSTHLSRLIIRYVDFEEMGKWVAGRNAWKNATDKERSRFLEEFRFLIIQNYSNVLMHFKDSKVTFRPLNNPYLNKRRICVFARLNEEEKPPVQIVFYLVKKNTEWKLYDLVVEGVSIIKLNQAQFSTQIHRKGLNSVTEDLYKHRISHQKK